MCHIASDQPPTPLQALRHFGLPVMAQSLSRTHMGLRSFAIILLACLASASSIAREPRLKEAEVIRRAKRLAIKEEVKLSDYEMPKVRYIQDGKEDWWWLFYEGKTKKPGNYFTVWINDKTTEVMIFPGE